MRRFARILSVALITAGIVILADAGATLAWKEPLSAIYGSVEQRQAEGQLDDVSAEFLAGDPFERLERIRDPAERLGAAADLYAEQLEIGKPIGRIRIPSIDVEQVIIQGDQAPQLDRGPGHYPDTAIPGQGKTIGIAGHRTTYGAPFHEIDKIEVGDEVEVEMPYGTFTYEVTDTRIVDPTGVQIVDDTGSERLVLTACHPLYSAAQRYAIFAKLSRARSPDGDPLKLQAG